jgi:hypothetical protein
VITVVALLAVGLLLIALAVLAVLLLCGAVRLERAHRRKAATWRVSVSTGLGGTSVLVVREEGGVVTGRVLVARIPSGAPDWLDKYQEAVAEAGRRAGVLRRFGDAELEALADATAPDAVQTGT